jgi:gliding motility-associated lipoprotein GldH|tara:strand:- start:352 stop:828 length:477 start_codon:yes stop_codon:yes gene_type:complete
MKLLLLSSSLILILFLSCSNENTILNEYLDIPDSKFSFLDTINFQVEIDDTINNHDVFLQLRTSTDYKWSNMFVFSDIEFPNGKTRSDTFQIFITDKKGHWKGNKSGAIVNFNHYLYKNIKFPIKGKYQFKFNQAMRDTVLNDVISLGLKIIKPNKKS